MMRRLNNSSINNYVAGSVNCTISEKSRGKNFLQILTTGRDGPVKSTETRWALKHQKITLLQKNHGKERLEDYSTSVA